MRYSRQQRKAFGEAFGFLNGGNAMRLVLSSSASRDTVSKRSSRRSRNARKTRRYDLDGSYDPNRGASANMQAGFGFIGIILAVGMVSVGLGLWAVAKMSSLLLEKMRRPQYYPQEKSRRERLARERRRVRDRFTTNNCPDPDKLLEQYAKAKTGAREALIFGSMLCDLEAYCDNSLVRNEDGVIIGRNPGMKGWIGDNCPKLLAHYKNAMRYKGLAEKFRQAVGAADPVPAAALAAKDDGEIRRLLDGKKVCKITVRMKKTNGPRGGKIVSGTYALKAEALEAAWGYAREILGECEGKADNRPRCGKTSGKETEEDREGNGNDRLRCGKDDRGETKRERNGSDRAPSGKNGRDGERQTRNGGEEERKTGNGREEERKKRNGRGEVVRLAMIIDEKLDKAPVADLSPGRWRMGGAAAGNEARAGAAGGRASA